MATYSTEAEARTAYFANTDYDAGAGDLTACQAFISACRSLLAWPEEARIGSGSQRMNLAEVRRRLEAAERWAAANGTTAAGATVRHVSFEGFRD